MTRLSAPANSGYTAEFETLEAAREDAARLLDVDLADMVEVVTSDGGTTCCYASQAEAEEDQSGAYSVQYSTVEEEEL